MTNIHVSIDLIMVSEFIHTFFQIIIYAGIVQGFYSAVILTHTRLRNPANQYLSCLLIVLSVSIIHSVFVIPYFHQFHQIRFHLKEPFILLVIPFIYLYVKKLNEPAFRFKALHLIHFAPFLIVMMFSFFSLIYRGELTNHEMLNSHVFAGNLILYVTALIQNIFYFIYILGILRSFKSKALNELSNTENIDPAWLRIFLLTFFAVFVLMILMMVIAIHKLEVEYFNPAVSLIFALANYIAAYKGLFQQTILPRPQLKSADDNQKSNETKIDDTLLQKLLDYMVTNKPFREPELSLTSLAAMINISRNQLSEIINTGTGNNFYDFVNKYRVEEVKQLMENPRFKDYTILAIAFEAGFASKSTFNSIFRKVTGTTPSEYKDMLKQKVEG